jgi:hypothetical protein
MKDILVVITSRDKPDKCKQVINMVFDNATSNNFDVYVIIDDDQINMYQEVINDKRVKMEFIKHRERGDWSNITKKQHEIMKKGYYFLVSIPDDIFGFNEGWDSYILEKKGFFKDDLFVLYTQCTQWGRDTYSFNRCYTLPDNRPEELNGELEDSVDWKFEQTPIATYKFLEFIYPLFEEPYNYKNGRELVIAQVIKLLYLNGINRHVECGFDYGGVICDYFQKPNRMEEYTEEKRKGMKLYKKIESKMRGWINEFSEKKGI